MQHNQDMSTTAEQHVGPAPTLHQKTHLFKKHDHLLTWTLPFTYSIILRNEGPLTKVLYLTHWQREWAG